MGVIEDWLSSQDSNLDKETKNVFSTEPIKEEEEESTTRSFENVNDLVNHYADEDNRLTIDSPFEPIEGTLKKDDLKKGPYADDIRRYMVFKKGDQYKKSNGISDDDMVEDFFNQRRWTNTNILSTAGEARAIYNANDQQKQIVKRAYELYDRTGNMFVNDGVFGAVDGMFDYVSAAATDGTNWLGLIPWFGQAQKLTTYAGQNASKLAIRTAINKAGKDAVRNGANLTAAKQAGIQGGMNAAKVLANKQITSKAADQIIKQTAIRESRLSLYAARQAARNAVIKKEAKKLRNKNLIATGVIDANFAMLHDYQIQGLSLDVGAQENYNPLQTAFSSLLGAVPVAGSWFFGKVGRNKSGLEDAATKIDIAQRRTAIRGDLDKVFDKDFASKVTNELMQNARSWETKWKAGNKTFSNDKDPATSFLKHIVLGENGLGNKSGLVHTFKSEGYKVPKGMKVADMLTNVAKVLPQKELDEANAMLKANGITLGDMAADKATNLEDLLASVTRTSAQNLNVFSQASKIMNAGILVSDDIVENATAKIMLKEEEYVDKARLGRYGQNVWRRLLVSSPSTTAVNIAGWGQYYTGTMLADVLSGTSLTLSSLVVPGKKGTELRRMGKIYNSMLAHRMKHFADPYTTHDAYMALLKTDPKLQKVLFETYSGGIERSGVRYGIDPKNPWFKKSEQITEAANRLTGVRIQDSFTKSQIFMTELDKYLRIKSGQAGGKETNLEELLNTGQLDLLDDEIIGSALDSTLRSVFSKDYTIEGQTLLAPLAKQVESFSNIPVLGTVLPFGRFMNNTVATAFQWSPLAMPKLMGKIAKSETRTISTMEAWSRSVVGTSALILAMQQDEEKLDKGLAYHENDVSGTIVSTQNLFPYSLWQAAGRIGNLAKRGEYIPPEIKQDMLKQLAVGQFAKDLQFGNDLNNVLDVFLNQEEGARKATFDAFYKQGGSILAGFTRPIDAVNRMVGYMQNTDAAKDVRQARGVSIATQSATKYIDNLIEIFTDKIDSVTGEEMRVGSREGTIQDANPLARALGVTVKPRRTSTEMVYSIAQMHDWTASERSEIPAYDKIFNTILAPRLERASEELLLNPKFADGSVATKRLMLKAKLKEVRSEAREWANMSSQGMDTQIAVLRRKAATASVSKEVRSEAMKAMRELGFSGSIRDMGYKELNSYMTYLEYFKQVELEQ